MCAACFEYRLTHFVYLCVFICTSCCCWWRSFILFVLSGLSPPLKEWASLKDLKALRNELKAILQQGSSTTEKNDPRDTRDTPAASNKTTSTMDDDDADAKNRDEEIAVTSIVNAEVKTDPGNVLLSPVAVPASS